MVSLLAVFGNASGVVLGHAGVSLHVFCLIFSSCYFLFFCGVTILFVTTESFPRSSSSDVLPVVLWLVLFLGCVASFWCMPGYFVKLSPCGVRFPQGS